MQEKEMLLSGSRGPVDMNGPPPKFGRGMNGVNTPGAPRGTMTRGVTLRGAFSRGSSSGRGQSRNVPQGSQASTPSMYCNYCGKTNHTEDRCWKKEGKCLKGRSSDHQLAACPKAQERSGVR